MSRLFVAIDLPDEVKAQLAALCSGINEARWVKPEQMHLTLRFIGEMSDTEVEAIKMALGAVHAAPFAFYLKGVGQFPPKGSASVIWAGMKAPVELERLHREIETSLVKLGHKPADMSFSPHITLARLKSPSHNASTNLRQYFDKHCEFESATITVSHFSLYSSTLAPQGSIYQSEATYPLFEH